MKSSMQLYGIKQHITGVLLRQGVHEKIKALSEAELALKEVNLLDRDLISELRADQSDQGDAKHYGARLLRAHDAVDDTDRYLFRCNGYMAAVNNATGLVAVRSELVDNEDPMTIDPVEANSPRYSHMAVIEAIRAAVFQRHAYLSLGGANRAGMPGSGLLNIQSFCERFVGVQWPPGQYSDGMISVGVAGGLFMHGTTLEHDIRAELMLDTVINDAAKQATFTIDQLSGVANQLKAELSFNSYGDKCSASIEQVKSMTKRYISRGHDINDTP
jgi:hypothetical protein